MFLYFEFFCTTNEIFLKPICIFKSLIPVIFFVCTRKIISFVEQLEQVPSTTFVSYQQIALKLCVRWQLSTASKFWISRVLSVLAQFCVHQAQPCGPNKWMSNALRVGVNCMSKSMFQIKVLFLYFGVYLDYERVVPSVKSEIYEQN